MAKFEKGLPRHSGAGRKVGTPNKANREIREVISSLVNNRADNLPDWLDRIAKDDPARALELYLKMTEYVLPKLSRTEHTGGSVSISIKSILADINGRSAGLPDLSEIEEAQGWEGKLIDEKI